MSYSERLTVPWTWWLVGLFLVASLFLAVLLLPGPWPFVLTLGAAALIAAALIGYGRVPVRVGPDGLRAGRALLPLAAVGRVEPLSATEAARLRGTAYEPRAYYVIRSYVPSAVLVEVDDSADPTPFWYVATRHPDRLAAALAAARSS